MAIDLKYFAFEKRTLLLFGTKYNLRFNQYTDAPPDVVSCPYLCCLRSGCLSFRCVLRRNSLFFHFLEHLHTLPLRVKEGMLESRGFLWLSLYPLSVLRAAGGATLLIGRPVDAGSEAPSAEKKRAKARAILNTCCSFTDLACSCPVCQNKELSGFTHRTCCKHTRDSVRSENTRGSPICLCWVKG